MSYAKLKESAVLVLMTPEEKKQIRERAEAERRSLSSYCLNLILDGIENK